MILRAGMGFSSRGLIQSTEWLMAERVGLIGVCTEDIYIYIYYIHTYIYIYIYIHIHMTMFKKLCSNPARTEANLSPMNCNAPPSPNGRTGHIGLTARSSRVGQAGYRRRQLKLSGCKANRYLNLSGR